MKTANFTYVDQITRCKIYGKVTLKHDDKVSISLLNARDYSWRSRNNAKALAQIIVANDFKHEAITHFVEQKDSSGLIALITEKTQDLKREYITKCENWDEFSLRD